MKESNIFKVDNNMGGLVGAAYLPKNLTASGQIKASAGILRGAFVASHTSGTIKIWNNTAGSGTVLVNTITLSAGTYGFLDFGNLYADTGLFATLGGTIDVTFSYL